VFVETAEGDREWTEAKEDHVKCVVIGRRCWSWG